VVRLTIVRRRFRPDPSWEGGWGRARPGMPGPSERRQPMVLDPGREYGTGDPADEPDVREDQQRELEEERARDDDDLGEEAPLGPGP
jgi:hypothetical protein